MIWEILYAIALITFGVLCGGFAMAAMHVGKDSEKHLDKPEDWQ
jgi:hypothetical protein